MRNLKTVVVGIGPVSLLALGVGAAAAAPATGTVTSLASSGGVKIAYYTQWSMYQNAFYPKNLDTEGVAAKTTILQYAFENIDPVNLTCFETTKSTTQGEAGESDPNAGDGAEDEWADYQKPFDASISVDGVGDTYNTPLAGQFGQLKKLKAKYPNVQILLSLGGWTYSKYFSDVAATAASRQKFVSSCIDMFIKGNLPIHDGVHGGAGVAAGIFDGFDIDWEYPGSPAGHLGNHYSSNDTANYTLLLAAFRSQLDALGGGHRLLTAALPGGADKIAKIETGKIGQYLDYGSVMTFDDHGGFWEPSGPTNHQTGLYTSPNDPMKPVPPGTQKYSVNDPVQSFVKGDPAYGIPGGFPAAKLAIGYPMYYRGWTGVPAGNNHGLYGSATGPAPGNPLSGNVRGVSYYKEIKSVVDNDAYWDDLAKAAYFYDGNNWWSGENARSVQAKADYQHCQGLAGAMVYSLEDDDPSMSLYNTIVNATNGSAPGVCTTPPTGGPTTPPTTGPTTPPTTGPTTPPTTPPTTGPGQYPAWQPNHAYATGALVSYNGINYQCIQGHTSLPGWEPPNVPALWKALS